jgi:hypothetical protein
MIYAIKSVNFGPD